MSGHRQSGLSGPGASWGHRDSTRAGHAGSVLGVFLRMLAVSGCKGTRRYPQDSVLCLEDL
jgi:hypothetical protein